MDAKIRKVVSQLKKASQAHARQAAMLEKMIKSNGKTKKKYYGKTRTEGLFCN